MDQSLCCRHRGPFRDAKGFVNHGLTSVHPWKTTCHACRNTRRVSNGTFVQYLFLTGKNIKEGVDTEGLQEQQLSILLVSDTLKSL
jgi:hypothetical protein